MFLSVLRYKDKKHAVFFILFLIYNQGILTLRVPRVTAFPGSAYQMVTLKSALVKSSSAKAAKGTQKAQRKALFLARGP